MRRFQRTVSRGCYSYDPILQKPCQYLDTAYTCVFAIIGTVFASFFKLEICLA